MKGCLKFLIVTNLFACALVFGCTMAAFVLAMPMK